MKQEITITLEHLERALAQPWDTETCLLAQAGDDLNLAMPAAGRQDRPRAHAEMYTTDGPLYRDIQTSDLDQLRHMFDFAYDGPENNADERALALGFLYAALPLTLEVDVS